VTASADTIRRGLKDHFHAWLPSTLAQACRLHGLAPDALPQPTTWKVVPTIDAMAADQLPALFVTSPGAAPAAEQDGDGDVSATWRMQTFVIVRGQTFEDVARDVAIYTLAVRLAAVQHPTLSGIARDAVWAGETYDVLDPTAGRTLGGGRVDLDVTVDVAHNVLAGPAVPPDDPYALPPADPTVDDTGIEDGHLDQGASA
jgi:hypothetical protein